MEEAIQSQVDFIIAYHPLLFSAIKKLTMKDAISRTVIRAISENIAVYSPHTAFDSFHGGVNDWLASGLGEAKVTKPIQPYVDENTTVAKLVVFVPQTHVDVLRQELGNVEGVGVIGNYSLCSFNLVGTGTFLGNEHSHPVVGQKQQLEKVEEVRLELICPKNKLPEAVAVISKHHPYETPAWEAYPIVNVPSENIGQGRLVTLKDEVSLAELLERVKKHLEMPHLRVALNTKYSSIQEAKVRTVAVCAGAGESVVTKAWADVYLTGEMRHHDVLASTQKGTTVILADHSNTERGFLKHFRDTFQKELGSVQVVVSTTDADPLFVI